MKTKMVAFDWDGVLCDSLEAYMPHFNTVLALYGKPPISNDDFRERFSAPTSKETFRKMGIAESGVNEAARKFLELTRSEPRPKLFPDVCDIFRWLCDRNIRISIVSAHPKYDIYGFIVEHDLTRFVHAINGSALGEGKVDALQKLIADNQLSADELVFVDDMDSILAMARRTGCYIVGSLRGYCSEKRIKDAQPHKIIRNMKNLEGYINYIHHLHLQMPPGTTSVAKASGK